MPEETIVDRIRTLANAQGLSLPALEVRLNIGNGTISRWNKSAPNTDKLSRVADFFHVSLDYLLGRTDQKENSPSELVLTEGERSLIELFRLIPEEKQRAFLEMGRLYADSLRKD